MIVCLYLKGVTDFGQVLGWLAFGFLVTSIYYLIKTYIDIADLKTKSGSVIKSIYAGLVEAGDIKPKQMKFDHDAENSVTDLMRQKLNADIPSMTAQPFIEFSLELISSIETALGPVAIKKKLVFLG